MADDGFSQVMLATRGNTEMEQMVSREKCVVPGDMSEGLGALEIRYGELISGRGEGGGMRLGFGTVDETVSLRRRR